MKRLGLAGLAAALVLIGGSVGWKTLRSPVPGVAAVAAPTAPERAPTAHDANATTPPTATRQPAPQATGAAPAPPRHKLVLCDERNVVEVEAKGGLVLRDASVKPNAGAGLLDVIRRALASSGDAKSQAAGLYLAAIEASYDRMLCSPSDCNEAQTQASPRAASALATFARNAKEPAAYSWALAACRSSQADPVQYPACGNFSVQHWADAAPNNVWPWLQLAVEARLSNDRSGIESAMHRASLASDWIHPDDEARRLMVSKLPANVTTAQYLEALVRVLNIDSGKLSGISSLSAYCGANQDANKQQTCARLADGMLSSAKDLVQLGVAIKIGEHSGLNKDRLDQASAQRKEAEQGFASTTAMFKSDSTASGASLACRFTDIQAQLHLRAAEAGELTAARELARSHKR